MNGRPVPFHVAANDEDQHVATQVSASGKSNTLTIRVRNDFGVSYESSLPPLGSPSQGLRMLSESLDVPTRHLDDGCCRRTRRGL